MRLCSFNPTGSTETECGPGSRRLGLVFPDGICDVTALAEAGTDRLPRSMSEALQRWDEMRPRLQELAAGPPPAGLLDARRVALLPPVPRPLSFRDFYAFEQHVKTARGHRGLEMVPQWYEIPVFYFSNPAVMVGAEASVSAPPDCRELDYELEIGAVIGRGGRDLAADEAEDHIAGYCVLNDWSARDLQRREMKVGLGPAKGKDFATGLGPWLVTPDELADVRAAKGYDLAMTARRNGKELSRGNWRDIHFGFGEMLARASRGVDLYPGDVIGSGTVGTGCILELRPERAGGWLQPGDVVELEIERLGVLRNQVTAAAAAGDR